MKIQNLTPNRVNNFDLLRIFAALQVVVHHSLEHLEIDNEIIKNFHYYFLQFFPGVPIFFFISGFLIYWSYTRNSAQIVKYFKNRFLRIFPGLWSCLILTIILLLIDAPSKISLLTDTKFWAWTLSQLSIFQFYTPDVLRFWGVGTPNGSLWTIIIELEFYFVIPMLFFLKKKHMSLLLLVFFISVGYNYYMGAITNESIIIKLLKLNILPYLYYFLFGVFFFIFWDKIFPLIKNKVFTWFIIYIIFYSIVSLYFRIPFFDYWISSSGLIKLIGDLLLCMFVASFSYSNVNLSGKLLKGNDISYGVYIYHMIVVNFMVQRGLLHKPVYLFVVIFVTIILATLSWKFVEKPALRLKKHQLKLFNKTF